MHQSSTTLRTVTMYSTKMSFKSLILVLTLVVYSIGQVSALNCYVCASNSDGDCYKTPKQRQFETDCKHWQTIPELTNRLYSGFGSNVQSILSEKTRSLQLSSSDYECVTIEGEIANRDSVVRVCSPKVLNCQAWEKTLEQSYGGLKIKSCHQCESDYCNSSSQLSVGFLSLMGSLLTILWMKN